MAAVMATLTGISGRYAAALFELAAERGAVERVGRDLSQLEDMLENNPSLQQVVASPIFGREDQINAMVALTERAGMDVLSRNFVGLIASNRRLHLLSEMIEAFHGLLAANRGEITGEVISAYPLEENQLNLLKSKLESAIGSEVLLKTKTDKKLLGGLIIKVASRMIDNSLSTKLQNLRSAMKGAG